MPSDENYKPHLNPEELFELKTPYADVRPFSGEHMTFNFVDAKAGSKLDTHSHTQEQFTVIHSGRARFIVEGHDPIELGAREVLYVAPNVLHSSEILEDMISLDVFGPVNEELMQMAAEAQKEAS
jgi:mannose-6-phosphate isomerase-like protein (cupin superfamily)